MIWITLISWGFCLGFGAAVGIGVARGLAATIYAFGTGFRRGYRGTGK